MFASIKPLYVSVFFHDHLQGVLRCALCRYYSFRWFAFVEFVLLRNMWSHVYVICVCLVFLSVGDLLVNSTWVGLYNKNAKRLYTNNIQGLFFTALLYCSNSWTSLHFLTMKSHNKTLKIRHYMFWFPLKPSSESPWSCFVRLLNWNGPPEDGFKGDRNI
jgi:hypothetical protein